MAYPIIILGAGASSDYIYRYNDKKKEIRPPITQNLFNHRLSRQFIDKNYEFSTLASIVLSEIHRGESLEKSLSEQKTLIGKNRNKLKQFVALQLYLQDLFREISVRYKQRTNNYEILLDAIENTESKIAYFVNFNYDTLLESELSYPIKKINHLIESPIKVIKIHGAYDWGYFLNRVPLERRSNGKNMRSFILENHGVIEPQQSKEIEILNKDNLGNELALERDTLYDYFKKEKDELTGDMMSSCFVPAIAIPIPNKTSWICPNSHIEELRKALNKTDRILIIGWSASDSDLIEIIKDELSKRQGNSVKITIVSQDIKSAEEIALKLNEEIQNASSVPSERIGFSDFIISGDYKKFFSE